MFAILAAGTMSSLAYAGANMTNQDVIDMLQAKMNENTIIKAIGTAETRFDTSAKALIKLNAAKVPETVIQAMIDAENGSRTPATNKAGTAAGTLGTEEILLIDGTQQTSMRYVTPQTRTGTRGLGYGGLATYAVLAGKQATLRLTTKQPTFLVAIPSNIQPESYIALVSLATRRNETREVLVSSGGGFASYKSGIAKDRILSTQMEKDPDQSKAAAGFTIYRIRPASPLTSGEYTMVLSNTQAKSISGLDNYFDFGVDG
jgi:hypothetical protein